MYSLFDDCLFITDRKIIIVCSTNTQMYNIFCFCCFHNSFYLLPFVYVIFMLMVLCHNTAISISPLSLHISKYKKQIIPMIYSLNCISGNNTYIYIIPFRKKEITPNLDDNYGHQQKHHWCIIIHQDWHNDILQILFD